MDDENVETGDKVEKTASFAFGVAVGEPDHSQNDGPEDAETQCDIHSPVGGRLMLDKRTHF